ncbi:metallophosphoesterase family protein [Rhodopirellula sp. JC639]|uniref:metallophosphoesterase family protein n=1 Tax=Stieleria mannarensis TaxID=2755585 RepID=UPI0016008918|nr:metallophosphoesterase [Rhodopirellula sp. JC639]
MNQRKRLATFVQISDLHFASIDPQTGALRFPAWLKKMWANTSRFDGLLGHSHKSLVQLSSYVASMRHRENAEVIFTGDATSCGAPDQFDLADDYLATQLLPPIGNHIGLHASTWRDLGIAGNHDQWPGDGWMLGNPNGAVKIYFPGLPDVNQTRSLPCGRLIRFVRIDSDADIGPNSLNRAMARGAFQSQLAVADKMLDDLGRREHEIRVMLIHHSYHCRGKTLSMKLASHQALSHFLSDHCISVVMTGHLHVPLVHRFVPPVPESNHVLETRCGTTTQTDRVPLEWKTLRGKFPKRAFPKNTLLLHRLFEDNRDQLFWTVEVIERTRVEFKPVRRLKTKEIRVHPYG